MSDRPWIGRSRLAPLVLAAVVLVVPAVLYLGYVLEQLSQVSSRNLRLLEGAASRLEDVLSNSAATVRNLAADLSAPVPTSPAPAPAAERIRDFVRRQPFLSLVSEPVAEGEGLRCAGSAVSFRKPAAELQLVSEGCSPRLVFRVELGAVLGNLALDEAFDHLLLAGADGRVVFQMSGRRGAGDARSGLRIERLDGLVAKRRDGDGEVLELETFQRASVVEEVELARRPHQLLCQPVVLERRSARPDDEAEAPWSLCGLVPVDRSLEEALAVAPQLAFLLVLLFILGLVTWPLVKLLLMNRRERLRFSDAYLLLETTLSLILLLTVLVVDRDAFRFLRLEHEERLGELAAAVASEFLAELEDLQDQLVSYDRALCTAYREGRLDLAAAAAGLAFAETRLLAAGAHGPLGTGEPAHRHFSSVFWMDGGGWQIGKGTVRDQNTPRVNLEHRPYFRRARDGRLWSFEDDVHRRPFAFDSFRSITTGEHSTALSLRSCLGDELQGNSPAPLSGPVVAAISSEPLSVMAPVLPPGYGFALFDADGTVLFHSDGRRALEGSLFDDVEELARLQAAMYSRSAQTFGSRYLARPHLLHVEPMSVVPWWLVTFYDVEILRTVNLEALAHAVLLALVYLLLFNLPPLAYVALAGRRIGWLWPDSAKRALYARLAWQFAALVVLGAVVLLATPLGASPGFWFLLPAVTLAMTAAQFVAWRSREQRPESGPASSVDEPLPPSGSAAAAAPPRRWDGVLFQLRRRPLLAHLAAVVLLWQLIAVLPGLGFFRLSFEDSLAAMFQYEALDLAAGVEERRQRLERFYEEAGVDGDAVEQQERPGRRGIYLTSIFDPRLDFEEAAGSVAAEGEAAASVLRSHALFDAMARYKPPYNDTSTRLRYLQAGEAADGDWSVRVAAGGGAVFTAHPPGSGRVWRLATEHLRWVPRPGPFTWLGGGALLLLLVLWVRHSAHNLFFARIGRQVRPLEVHRLLERRWRRSVIAQLASPQDRRRLSSCEHLAQVDLEGPRQPTAAEQLAAQEELAEAPVVCERFESALEDPSARDWKLRQLEELVLERKRVVILPTALNPFEDLLCFGAACGEPGDGEEEAAVRLEPEEARRWGRLLSEFGLVPVGLTRAGPGSGTGQEDGPISRSWLWRSGWESRELLAAAALEPLAEDRLLPSQGVGRQEALERLVEAAEGYYWALWTACSADEKLVLVQLAQEGFVNPKQAPTVRRLLQRGLVVRDPCLRLMNESFTLFVNRIHEPLEVARLERLTQGLGWQQARWALLGLLATLAIFLFVTQQALFDATVGFLSALTIGVPGLLKLISTLRSSGGRGAAQ